MDRRWGACRFGAPSSLAPTRRSRGARRDSDVARGYASLLRRAARMGPKRSSIRSRSIVERRVRSDCERARTATSSGCVWHRAFAHGVAFGDRSRAACCGTTAGRTGSRHEVFPLSLKSSGGGQWYPNYQLHLVAGGADLRAHGRMVRAARLEDHPARGRRDRIRVAPSRPRSSRATACAARRGRAHRSARSSIRARSSSGISSGCSACSAARVEFTDWPGQPTLSLPVQDDRKRRT